MSWPQACTATLVSSWNFKDGLAQLVFSDSRFGFMDTTGRVVIGPLPGKADGYSEGLAAFKQDDRWGYLDRTGKVVVPPQFLGADEFHGGRALVAVDTGVQACINRRGEVVFRSDFDLILPFSEGRAGVMYEEEWGYVDTAGRLVIPLQFDDVEPFSEGLAAVEIDGEYGYIDLNGKMVIEPEYDGAGDFQDGLAAVRTSLSSLYIDRQNRVVWQCRRE